MSGYVITFAPTLDRPPETMVGETVFDAEGNAIGWMNAPTEPDEATMLKLHSRMNAALLDMYEVLVPEWHREGISMDELIDCVIRAHQIVEDAAVAGVGTCVDKDSDPNDFKCSACGARSFIQANDTYTTILEDHLTVLKKFNYCPNCGKRIIKDATE